MVRDITDSLKKAGVGLGFLILTGLPLSAQKMYKENNYLFSKETRMYAQHVSGARGNNETYCFPRQSKGENNLVHKNNKGKDKTYCGSKEAKNENKNVYHKSVMGKPYFLFSRDANNYSKKVYTKDNTRSYCDSKKNKNYYQHKHTQRAR